MVVLASHILLNKFLLVGLSKAHYVGTGGTEVGFIYEGVGCGGRLRFGGRAAVLVPLSFAAVLSLFVLLLSLLEAAWWNWEIIRRVIFGTLVFGRSDGRAASQIVYI